MLVLLAACEPAPTPFPVEVPVTPTPTPEPTEIPPIRYALGQETLGAVSDFNQIAAVAQIEQLNAPAISTELGFRYDLVATFGEYTGWNRSEIAQTVMLVMNPASQPLTMQIGDLIARALNPQAIANDVLIPGIQPDESAPSLTPTEIRSEFANLGRPDGFVITMGHLPIPGIEQVTDHLMAMNIEPRLTSFQTDAEIINAFETGQIQMALIFWTSAEEKQNWIDRSSVDFAIDLYTLPISYQAIPELTITFPRDGWPLPSR